MAHFPEKENMHVAGSGWLGPGAPAGKGQAQKPSNGFARDARKAGPSFVVFQDVPVLKTPAQGDVHPARGDIARERAELTEELERCHSLLQLVAAEEEEQVGKKWSTWVGT